MAGPYYLSAGASKGGIPTWGFGRNTKVIINSRGGGRVAFKAGGSPTEYNDVRDGESVFWRNFGGVYLTITNEGANELSARTE